MRLSLNPYGLSYTVGLQGWGTGRANPQAIGLAGFIATVRELGLSAIELDHRWLTPLDAEGLVRLRDQIGGLEPVCSFWLSHTADEDLRDAVRCTSALGAGILRFHLTPVLEGARAKWGNRWTGMLAHARATLRREAPRVADAGLVLAIENHQDLGSEELVEFAEELGPHVGVTLDAGNPFSVGEDPLAFTRRAAHRIFHVHLKDYVAQFTIEGYRLIRCAIGDGAVPFEEIAAALAGQGRKLIASIEPGALEARHIRLFTPEWWEGYPPRDGREVAIMLGRLRRTALAEGADYRTPWEKAESGASLMEYELAQIRRSVANVRAMGIVDA